MSEKRPKPQPREAQREREVQNYYQGWLSAHGSALNVALNVNSLAAADLKGVGYEPKPSQDEALAAFAQLAVLRLNVKRAMVSLIDKTHQMILAEATRNLFVGLVGDTQSADLWLGSTILVRQDAMCEHCLTNTYTVRDPANAQSMFSAPALVVPDCRNDERFHTRPYVVSEPGVRFYAGVPIISRNGHKIGAYAVSDERPRHGLTMEELQFMQGVAQAVMEHLEWAQDRVDRCKGERIVRGLASFIGDSQSKNQCASSTDDDLSKTPSTLLPPQLPLMRDKQPLPGTISSTAATEGYSVEEQTSIYYFPGNTLKNKPISRRDEQNKPDGLQQMFNRATEILRQATLAEGVVLFDATATPVKYSAPGGKPNNFQSSNDETLAEVASGPEVVSTDSSDAATSPTSRPCKVLAYSITDDAALYSRMARHFFFDEDGADISSEDHESTSDRDSPKTSDDLNTASCEPNRRRNRMDHEELFRKIPRARVVVFLPLYGHTEEMFAGGCFLWASVAGRMMNWDEDLSYLQAFGNSIMSELERINGQKHEAAKTTFIASMSHELRTPLHGILGAAEFLIESAVDSYQSGLIASISTCGKTLLDTLNHVLDYSKINTLGRVQVGRQAKQNKLAKPVSDSSMESMNLTAVVDLAILAEEVVDAVSAGHTFRKLPNVVSSGQSVATVPHSVYAMSYGQHGSSSQEEGPVSVLLDVAPKNSWMVKTQPGALRRIIMNLLGNALKYTPSGYVLVSLSGEDSPNGAKTDALIRVIDTGKGMSEEFRRNGLFVPFSQEDSFQPGTGLGLSIVKQIVDSLGGSVELTSQLHKGTEVVVRLRLPNAYGNSPAKAYAEVHAIPENTKGLQLVLLEGRSPISSDPHAVNQQIKTLNETLTKTCSGWFNMKVIKEDVAEPDAADLYLYCEPPSVQSLQQKFIESEQMSGRNKEVPVIIVCLNAQEALKIAQNQCKALADLGKIVEVIPQPFGPAKLAKVFQHCLRRSEQMAGAKGHNARSVSPPLGPTNDSVSKVNVLEAGKNEKPLKSFTKLDSLVSPFRGCITQEQHSQSSPPPTKLKRPSLGIRNGKSTQGDQSRLHILLVDDNNINLRLLVMFVLKCGFTYEEAENGQVALDKFKNACLPGQSLSEPTKRFDFILMDISMPIMNGIDATRRIREFENERQLPCTNIIALTGLASLDVQRDAN
ncbi:DNA polymerase alpha/epsilon subunit B [Apiospora arundinis]